MLAQDMLTGYVHEVPDPRFYGLGEVHDVYGNSLGMFFLPKLISKLVGGGGPPQPAVTVRPPSCPPCPPCPSCGLQVRPPFPPYPYPYPPPPGYPQRRRRRRRS